MGEDKTGLNCIRTLYFPASALARVTTYFIVAVTL
jgi:hypothetical protein